MALQRRFGQQGAWFGSIGFLAVACVASSLQAQFPTPEVTKEHKVLRKDVGVWDAVIKFWMGGADSEPMVSKGVERNRMIGGLWLLSNYTGEFGGQEFKGHGLTGYDSQQKKYVGTWVDTMSAHINTLEGTYDEATSELTTTMTGIDPASGKEIKSKSVAKYTGKNTRVMTMYMKSPDGGDAWVKSMEITYTRRPRDTKKK